MPVGSPVIFKRGPAGRFSSPFAKLEADGARDLNGSNQDFSLASFAAANFSTTDIIGTVAFSRDNSGSSQVLISKRQDATNYWALSLQANNTVRFIAVVGGLTKVELATASAITNRNWNVVSWSVDRGNAAATKIYLNGVDDTDGTPTSSADDIDNTGALYVGQFGNGSEYANLQIARIGIGKNVLLTAANVTELYNGGVSKKYSDLAAALQAKFGIYYNADELAATDNLIDDVGSNDLTQANSPGVVKGP